jgi:DNA (cytosine-5)-methyltransferase 1
MNKNSAKMIPVFSLQGSGVTSQSSNGDGWNEDVSFTLNRLDVHGIAQPISFDMAQITSKVNGTRVEPNLPVSTLAKGSQMHVAMSVYENHPADSRVQEMGETCSTVTSRWGTGGGNAPMVTQPCFPISTQNALGRVNGRDDWPLGLGNDGDPAPTLTKSHGMGVAQGMAVRRLTPIECERLQGFCDNYTDIKPKGKATPDAPRYKALGNSMAVPVMAWIGKRIQEVENIKCKPNK